MNALRVALVTVTAFLAASVVRAEPTATPSPAPNFDGRYIGRRLSQDSSVGCTSREGNVTFNVLDGKVGTPLSGETTAPLDASGNFTLKYDLTIAGVGPATATFRGQIAGDLAKGTVVYRPASTAYTDCSYTFSAQKQAAKP